jgi:hypothetical protein
MILPLPTFQLTATLPGSSKASSYRVIQPLHIIPATASSMQQPTTAPMITPRNAPWESALSEIRAMTSSVIGGMLVTWCQLSLI